MSQTIPISIDMRVMTKIIPPDKACRRFGFGIDEANIIYDYPLCTVFLDDYRRPFYYHAGRIHYFVKFGISNPVLTEFSFLKGFGLIDGYHRYVAAYLRGDKYLKSDIRTNKMIRFMIKNAQRYTK